jgi:hypothetical protein
MMKRLQGRNLRHPGCLIGITAGLTIGIALAGGLAYTTIPYETLLWIWLGITVVLGTTGWIIGARMSPTASPEQETVESADSDPPSA